MAKPSKDEILAALSQVQDPELHRDIVSLNMVHDVNVDGGRVALKVVLTTPACPLKDEIERNIHSVLADLGASDLSDLRRLHLAAYDQHKKQ